MDEIKHCPFRKDEKGEFEPCYGAGCIAYLEYDQPVMQPLGECQYGKQETVRVAICRMMPQPPLYAFSSCV